MIESMLKRGHHIALASQFDSGARRGPNVDRFGSSGWQLRYDTYFERFEEP
jgi:hypothetical protein